MSAMSEPAINTVHKDDEIDSVGVNEDTGKIMLVDATEKGSKIMTWISDCALHIAKETRSKNDTEFIFVGRGARDGRTVRFTMQARDLADSRKFKATLINAFGSENKVGKLSFEMVQSMSLNIKKVRRIETPCWIDEEVYIPGRDWAGTFENIEYTLSSKIPAEVYDGDLLKAKDCLRDLLKVHKYSPILIAAIMGSPAVARWHKNDRFALGLWGGTGTLKTSTVLAAMGIYGTGYADSAKLKAGEDGSTSVGAMEVFAAAGILPEPYDNVKTVNEKDAKKYVGLINMVLEGDEKARGKKDGGLRDSKEFLCTPIITGEVKPQEAATSARVLNLDWTQADSDILRKVQNVKELLPVIGYYWVWHLSETEDTLCPDFSVDRGKKFQEFVGKKYVNPGRLASIYTILEGTWTMLENCPMFGDVFTENRDRFTAALDEAAIHQGEAVSSETELIRFLRGLDELLAASPDMFLNDDVSEERMYPRPQRVLLGKITKEGIQVIPGELLNELKKRGAFTQQPTEESLTRALKEEKCLISDPDGKHIKYRSRINGKRPWCWYIKQEFLPSVSPT